MWQGVERRAQHPTARRLRPSGRVIIWASDGFRAGRGRAELVLADLGNRLDKVRADAAKLQDHVGLSRGVIVENAAAIAHHPVIRPAVDAKHAYDTALDVINNEHDLDLPLAKTEGSRPPASTAAIETTVGPRNGPAGAVGSSSRTSLFRNRSLPHSSRTVLISRTIAELSRLSSSYCL